MNQPVVGNDFSHVQQYKLDNQILERSIYKREQGEYIVEKGLQKNQNVKMRPNRFTGQQTKYVQASKNTRSTVSISKYNQPQQNWLEKLFSCCTQPQPPVQEYQDCDYCQRRVYRNNTILEQDDDEPYISKQRTAHRQSQALVTFCDKLQNNRIVKQIWQTE